MDRPQPTLPGLYTAAEVARLLHCSEWWVKEQARRRRIPYTRIGGRYQFTAEHLAQIVRRFEVPALDSDPASVPVPRRGHPDSDTGDLVPLLRARPPRRVRATTTEAA